MFITPVSMKCTQQQYERDLKDSLLKMGYKEQNITYWSEYPYLCTNWGSNHNGIGNGYEYSNFVNAHNRYYIEEYNPQLFLALAAMTDDEEAIVGEYIIAKDTKRHIPKTPERVESIDNGFYKTKSNANNWETEYYRKATKEEIINHFTKKQNTMENRFPFKLSEENAKRIINIACTSWKCKLADLWSRNLLLTGYVSIEEDFYKEMRKACTEPQNELFDEIFGKDEPQYKVGDCVITQGYSDNYDGKVLQITKISKDVYAYFNVLGEEKEHKDSNFDINIHILRKATPEEIEKAKNKCPYKDGQYILVRDYDTVFWSVCISTGRFIEGRAETYQDLSKEDKFAWIYHSPLPKDFKVPE